MGSDEHTNGAVAAAVAPPEICAGLTLFQLEDGIALLAESAEEEGLTPEIERALVAYLQGALEKRDRVAEFILYCEGMAAMSKAEVQRLQGRQEHFESTAERVRGMALRVLDYLGVAKLVGRTHTLKKRKCPPSVAVQEEAKIPVAFKWVTVVLPLSCWEKLLTVLPDEIGDYARAEIVKQETTINLTLVGFDVRLYVLRRHQSDIVALPFPPLRQRQEHKQDGGRDRDGNHGRQRKCSRANVRWSYLASRTTDRSADL